VAVSGRGLDIGEAIVRRAPVAPFTAAVRRSSIHGDLLRPLFRLGFVSVPFNSAELADAKAVQDAAASDPSPQVRLIAGPGTGKSKTIEERVCWLLNEGVDPATIAAVSFTRASAQDLSLRVNAACAASGHDAQIAVSTLHSLALRVLKQGGFLEAFPVDPLVLDGWELEHIFDAEFSKQAGIPGKTRPRFIREDFEAFWSTGEHRVPDSQSPPKPPITDVERGAFRGFHTPRTLLYACVLPGELVQRCVQRIAAGTLNPAELLNIEHLIVDEFQDLNPMDLGLVDALANKGVTVFVAGDDDQSLYSFRYAAPKGIRRFTDTYPEAGSHSLRHCFRSTPAVLSAAESLISSNSEPERVPKEHLSMYDHADPRIAGRLSCWRFKSGSAEARVIAESVQRLCAAGMPARQIMVLLSNANALGAELLPAFDALGVPYEAPRATPFKDTECGRAVLTLLRLGSRDDDLVAMRTLFALRKGVGIGTAAKIANVALAEHLSYRDVFNDPDEAVFGKREVRAVAAVSAAVDETTDWTNDDLLSARADEIDALLPGVLGELPESDWRTEVEELPDGSTLAEALLYIGAEKDEQRARVLVAIQARLGTEITVEDALPDAVRVMTMHGAKGLSAQVVFIPGLEEQILPGERRRPYPGLVLEAARMLYVSITRARLACILSYAEQRTVFGRPERQTPSQFTSHLGAPFQPRDAAINDEGARWAVEQAALL
jgi:DNA helicase-2/ATP-dependent DNA helicase PcrA